MTPVHFHFVSPTGDPIVNADVEIQLSQAAFDTVLDGVVLPRLIQLSSDADGRAVANLWPNDAPYIVTALDPLSDAGVTYQFYVPVVADGVSVRLQDIVVEGTLPTVPYDAATLAALVEAKATTLSQMTTAVAASEAAGASEASALAAKGVAEASRDAAATSQIQAADSQAAAAVSQTAAAASAEVASAAADVVTSKAAQVAADAAMASDAADTAVTKASEAQGSAAVAAAAATYSGPTPPPNPAVGKDWVNTLNGKKYTWINDGNSGQWIEAATFYYVDDPFSVQAAVDAAAAAAGSVVAAQAAVAQTQSMVPHAGVLPPTSPSEGAEWWNYINGKRYVYVNDGSTSQWVESAGYYYLSDLTNVQRVSTDKGDAPFTLALGASEATAYVNTPLTANRLVTLTLNPGSFSTPDQANGGKFRVVRSSASTGAFTLDVGGLKSLSAGQWCDIQWNGAAWLLTGSGAL